MLKTADTFHKKVSDYYNQDADMGFEKRAEANPLLAKIRDDFRMITRRYPASSALEIGCGPGYDVAWFASEFPDKKIIGVDISERMVALARRRIDEAGLKNASVAACDERDLSRHYKAGQFDLIFVYFGALNTVADLNNTAKTIFELLSSGGHAVLTFVNKWYLREMVVQAMKLNFKTAVARLKKDWGGYSLDRHLPSRCYSPGEIKKAFVDFSLIEKKGYSIAFPAWYNYKKYKDQEEKTGKRWNLDQTLQSTFLWSFGEYTLFVLKKD